MRLVQITHPSVRRRVALVDGSKLRLLGSHRSIYAFALSSVETGCKLQELILSDVSDVVLDYDEVYSHASEWTFLPSFDHPTEPARCLVSGTGLTHLASAARRDAMHAADSVTDSIRMYQLGLEQGKPAPGETGAAPEWFYKGTGTILRGHGAPLTVPNFAEDGGEEPEMAAAYIIDHDGNPRRIGLTPANEFSDHKIEKQNYLYLAHSKLRPCSIGPELVLDSDFSLVHGEVTIERDAEIVWKRAISTGEQRMCHSLANIEHHHFKYEEHRRSGDAHVHFLGADAFSFGDGIALENGDHMVIQWTGYGRALRNPVHIDRTPVKPVSAEAL
ncbi:MAG TPA: AraD1 family protein [Bryobacteraceae bacterium]|nr:AraD1 family protein [Bryobacteraceae bacterium]